MLVGRRGRSGLHPRTPVLSIEAGDGRWPKVCQASTTQTVDQNIGLFETAFRIYLNRLVRV